MLGLFLGLIVFVLALGEFELAVLRWFLAGAGLLCIMLLVSGAARPKWQELELRKMLRKMKSERDELERFFEALMETVPSNIYFKDRNSKFLRVNQSMAEGLGAGHPADLVGKCDADFFDAKHAQRALADEEKILATGKGVEGYVEKEIFADGSDGYVLTAKLPFRDQRGRVLGTFGISSDVTEMVRTSETLEREKNTLRSLIDSIPDAIYVRGVEGKYMAVNQAMADFLNCEKPEDVVGKSPQEFFPDQKSEIYLAEDREVMESRKPMLNVERRIKTAGGQLRTVLISKVPVIDDAGKVIGIVGMNRDVTEERRMEQALMQTERRMKEIVDNSPSPIYVKSITGRYLMINRRFGQLFGVEESEIYGKTDAEVLGDLVGAARTTANDQRVAKTGEPLQIDETISFPSGERIFMSSKFPMLNLKGEVYAVGGISTDITERKMTEQELKKINGELRQANNDLKKAQEHLIQAEKMESIGRLASGVAHEVKNPLAMIGMGLELLARRLPEDDKKAAETVERMKRGIERAKKIVTGLVDFSSSRNLDFQPVSVEELVEESMDLVDYQLRAQRVTVRYDIPKNLPKLMVDRTRVQQVLLNLCINSMHAMENGGELAISAELVSRNEVEFDAGWRKRERPKEGDSLVRLTVRDEGSGIPEEALGKIFDPFFTTKPTGTGTGLGLAVSRKIAELHGGELSLGNRKDGKGAEASLTLKVAEDAL